MTEELDARIWLRAAGEYLEATQVLISRESGNFNTYPILVLLAFAYEHIFKVERQLATGSFERGHNLMELWEYSKSRLGNYIEMATTEFIKRSLATIPSDDKNAILETEPDHGKPNRTFEANIGQLNLLTDQPFQSRYPKPAVWTEVETQYLLFVAQYFQGLLVGKTDGAPAYFGYLLR